MFNRKRAPATHAQRMHISQIKPQLEGFFAQTSSRAFAGHCEPIEAVG